MKIQVRNHVFETNSSSMHSIAIIKSENLKGTAADHYGHQLTSEWLKPGKDVEINCPIMLNDDSLDFGRWPFRVLTTMYEKIQYAVAYYGTDEKFQEISDICKKYTGHGLVTPTRREWFKYYTTGLKNGDEIPDDHILEQYIDVFYDKKKEEWYRKDKAGNKIYDIESDLADVVYYGDVDHQSSGMLDAFLNEHNITLEQLLVDPKYVIIVDGDEYCTWEKMFEAGICLRENFEDPGLPDY